MLPAARPARRAVPRPARGPEAPPLRQRLRSLPAILPTLGRTDPPPTPTVLRRADAWTPPTDVERRPDVKPVDLDALADADRPTSPM